MQERTEPSFIQAVIIAVVLGMVARSVVPTFTRAGTDKALCILIERLEIMRTALDLYRAHHNGKLPPCESFKSFEAAMAAEVGRYKPHLDKIPVNPFNGLNTVRFDGEPAGSGKAGWRLDTNSGLFQADNDAACAIF
jgi:general secretion pathway protein G